MVNDNDRLRKASKMTMMMLGIVQQVPKDPANFGIGTLALVTPGKCRYKALQTAPQPDFGAWGRRISPLHTACGAWSRDSVFIRAPTARA